MSVLSTVISYITYIQKQLKLLLQNSAKIITTKNITTIITTKNITTIKF